ncbi:MAG: cation-translocating P-type ATPase [Pseudomonadota bacterium]
MPAELPAAEKPLWFCCQGCKMVYILLMEAADSPDPLSFRQTELFRRCQAAGVIPRSQKDLEIPVLTAPAEQGPAGHQLDIVLRIGGMWCPACAWVIEAAVSRVTGVYQASCSFSTDRFSCGYDPLATSAAWIVQVIEKLGYKAGLPDSDAHALERKGDWIRFGISAFLTLNIMMLSLALYGGFFTQLSAEDIQMIGWPIFGMATIVMIHGGRPIFQKARQGLMAGSAGMEVLISMGALSAYGYSVFNLWQGSFHLYFDTASMLVTLVLLGKRIESHVKNDIQASLDQFLNLMPEKVRRCSPGFPEGRYEASDRLAVGDVFILPDGEIAAADGVIIAGAGRIDTSSLTGEPLPVSVKTGDGVLSGCKVLCGRLSICASAVGGDSTLGQMIRLMETALGSKILLENKTDRILKWFVPGIVLAAVVAGFSCYLSGRSPEESLIRAITVLVISCPCALGIAIPLARVAGISMAAENGLLVRDFSALELADRITTVVFDKTGTLTTGSWSLLEIICLGVFEEARILAYAAALESRSRHYIAVEIRNRALQQQIDIPDAETIHDTGQGIEGRVDGVAVRIGSPAWICLQSGSSEIADQDHDAADVSRVFMHIADQPAAIFVFGDQIRPTSLAALKTLRQMGKKLAMISGDEPRAVKFVADTLGIKNFRGGLTPQEKAGFIGDLCQSGEKTAMVGDGVNDAPALAGADLAIAVHSGHPLGRETAGIVLMRGDPAQLPELLNLSRRVSRIVTQNLCWALIYNLIGVPVAVSGLLNPLVAVIAMLLSSLSVVGNTLRLMKKKE